MAKPNYSFEKRQRELKKTREKEEKRQEKLARKTVTDSDSDSAEGPAATDQEPDDNTP